MKALQSLFWNVLVAALMPLAAVAQNNAVPLVNEPLSPTSVFPGHRAFTLNVTGTGFVSGAVVNWNASARTTSFISSSHLQAEITSSDVAHTGTASVTVVNPTPGGGASNVVYFPVSRPSSALAFARRDLTLASGSLIAALAVGDFNKDGTLDVAIATSSTTVEVLLGNGDGTFQAPISTTLNLINNSGLSCGNINTLVAGDFNGDGNIDLAVGYLCAPFSGSFQDLLYIALGTGDGHFNSVGDGTIYGHPVAAADVNADGILDVVTTNPGYDNGDWYPATNLGSGSGLFGDGIRLGDTYAFGVGAFGDFNGDGKLDLALPGGDPDHLLNRLHTFVGNGDGTFQSPTTYPLSGKGWNAGTAAVADLNGDGKLDLVTDGIFVFLGNGDGTFTNIGGASINGGGVQFVDFNNDNKLDAVLLGTGGDPSQAGVTSLLGNGDGTFQNPQSWAALSYTGFPAIGDFNGDGKLDLVSAGTDFRTGVSSVSIFLQTTLAASPSFLSFGSVKVGTSSAPQTSTLTNIGQKDVSFGKIRLAGAGTNYTESNDCGASLAPGAGCSITVTFSPKSTTVLNASLVVPYRGAIGSPQSITLTGTGY